ncbi:site-specific integrase [Flammeovirga sp. SubArs3]|uniref:tyrosine-type recombinase/integrase n=1 Tax=Flammeovirga sp. SubArs3 TaxID=2995316 RepID=UPI00248C4A5F|nr:site-specific integrase [Flammeovirga sp. SubArs3]
MIKLKALKTTNHIIANQESYLFKKDIIDQYKRYLLEDDWNKNEQQLVMKSLTSLRYFLVFLIEFKQGRYYRNAFKDYTEYLQSLVETNEINTIKKAQRRQYARRINLENKLGYLKWLEVTKIDGVQEDKKLLSNTWDEKFLLWLKSKSRLRRDTKYPKAIGNVVKLYIQYSFDEYQKFVLNDLTVNAFLRNNASLKITTLNFYLTALKRFVDFLIEENVSNISQDEILKVKNLKALETSDEVNRIRISENDLKEIYSKGNQYQKIIIVLGSGIGLRGSSMVHLRKKDINFKTKKIKIWAKGKNNKVELPINKDVYDHLINSCEGLDDNDKLLPQNSTSSLSKYFSDYLHKIGKKEIEKNGEVYSLSLHNLRHTFAYNSLDKHGLLLTSRLLCHATTEVTEKHYLKDKIKDELEHLYDNEYK